MIKEYSDTHTIERNDRQLVFHQKECYLNSKAGKIARYNHRRTVHLISDDKLFLQREEGNQLFCLRNAANRESRKDK